jgi:hypothetical protein
MAEIITHPFVSAKTNSPDPTLVSSNAWNDGHTFSGGINGQVLVYDDTMPNNMRWTDGASGLVPANVVIPNGLTSPQNNYITLAFNTNSNCVLNLAVFFTATTTGGVDSFYSVSVDGVLMIGGQNVPSGSTSTQYRTLNIGPGAHLIDLDMVSAGHVTWTGGLIQIATTRFGI